ncbi:MAG: type I methionyl aminopeptidase [Bryobacterales bacterium]|nr:type I methionyl aminopeptidase [Bryobacterales bacterium]MDE0625504.1 type I methionyl aminopeptidase [Bryobacterales bacterium]
MIVRKSPMEIERMRASGRLVARVLASLHDAVRPGATTMDLERRARRMIRSGGATAAFKGYYVPAARKKFPAALCTSVNDEVVHGIPSRRRVLREGDIVKVDCGVLLDGYYGDSATTIPVGRISAETERLLRVTRESLDLAVEEMVDGRRLFDVSGAVQRHVEGNGFSIVKEFVGHGIGRKLHEEPQVPNHVDPKIRNVRLRTGMVLAIEPMVVAGDPGTRILRDRFTAVTRDGSNAAHFEHCVAVTENGPRLLTVA